MLGWSSDRYNPEGLAELEMSAVCKQEQRKAAKLDYAHETQDKKLLIISGQGGSGTRGITTVMQALPGVSVGPVSDEGQDSAVFHLPNFITDDNLYAVAHAHVPVFGFNSSDLDPILGYMQQGVCDAISAIGLWQTHCHPQASHIMLKEPLITYLMPFVLASHQSCAAIPYTKEKFVHVIRDPRIHHHPHKSIAEYDYVFSTSEKHAHEEQFRRKFSIGLDHAFPNAFTSSSSRAVDVMKFAAVWQRTSIRLYRSWSKTRPSDYYLLHVERISPPTPKASIQREYERMLDALDLPNPGSTIMQQIVDTYEPITSRLDQEPQLKVKIIEEFAGEALKLFDYV